MADQTYKVLREHHGDKPYAPGDSRELAPSDAKHLVDLGVLEEAKAKKAPAAKNKAEPPHSDKKEA